MKCKICGKESKYVCYDDGVCQHWDRLLTLKEIEELEQSK
jgi:hypothetical protein